MQYRNDKYGNKISILGYGCMRFTNKNGKIDEAKAEEEIMEAYRQGVNYYDTAYVYPGSEAALGNILSKNRIRDKVNIATKLPQYMINSNKNLDAYFNEELSRLKTDHIDYYLMHHMTDIYQWERLKSLGIEDWIADKKKEGKIRNIGFSYHGNSDMFIKILEDYDWDFCQIQYNYLDENSQAGRKGLNRAGELGIPVIIMEPLRGGKLVNMLPAAAKALIAADPKHRTAAELALRWLWEQPAVTCVLSGMNSIPMVEENCRIASDVKDHEFDDEDRALIEGIKDAIMAATKVGCTGCRYCMPCPQGVDIPAAFHYYNAMYAEKKHGARREYAQVVGIRKDPAFPSQCIGCGRCEKHCPQHISIIEELKKADKALRPLPYKIGTAVAKKMILKG